MFQLFSKVNSGLEDLAAVFCSHIKKCGLAIVEKKGAAASGAPESKERFLLFISTIYIFSDDESSFVKQLIDLHERHRQMISVCFQSNPLFQKALKEVILKIT